MMDAPRCTCVNECEVLSDRFSQSKQLSRQVKFWLKSVWQWFEEKLFASAEPKICQKVDRRGRIISWQVFDPTSGQTITFGSELEVQMWLEQRYYF